MSGFHELVLFLSTRSITCCEHWYHVGFMKYKAHWFISVYMLVFNTIKAVKGGRKNVKPQLLRQMLPAKIENVCRFYSQTQ